MQLEATEKQKLEDAKQPSSVPTDGETIQFFNHVWQQADQIRLPRKIVWEKAWNLYNGIYDWKAKAKWQSKIPSSKVRQAVDRAAASFRRALVRMKAFYSIESESKLGIQKGMFTKSIMDMWFDSAGFIDEFTTALKSGLITSTIILKVWWNYEEIDDLSIEESEMFQPRVEFGLEVGKSRVRKRKPVRKKKIVGKLGIKAVDPFKFWVVPGTKGRAVIEQTESNLAELEAMAAKGIYSREAVEKLMGNPTGDATPGGVASEPERKGEFPKEASKYIREVILYHYWGDIFGEDGKILMRDATFTVAGTIDGKAVEVLRKPRENPFFHGRSPYVWGTPYVVPFSTYNRGIVEDVIGVAGMICELSNLISDGAKFDAIKAFEVDVDLLFSPGDISNGIYPGLALRKKGLNDPSGQKQVVRAIDVGKIPQEALAALNMFNRDFQDATSITELVTGGSASGGGRRTLGEVSIKTSQALEGLDDAARTVEETVLNPLLEMAAKVIYQFHDDYMIPRLAENYPEVSLLMRELEPADRYVVMFGSSGIDSFHFRARGISIMLDKAQSLEKVTQFLQIASFIPGILQRLNVDAVLEEIVTALGWNPQKVILQPSNPGVLPTTGQTGGTAFPAQPDANTPAQEMAGQMGEQMGGSTNNPMAIDALMAMMGGGGQ